MNKLKIIENDPYLNQFREAIEYRRDLILSTKARLSGDTWLILPMGTTISACTPTVMNGYSGNGLQMQAPLL